MTRRIVLFRPSGRAGLTQCNLGYWSFLLERLFQTQAYRQGKLPFPDGSIIARLAWTLTPSEENNQVFGHAQSHVAGAPKNGVQFMLKDSRKYASTGGWGFAQFNEGKAASEAMLNTCYPCHRPLVARDLVFTRYAP